MPLYFLKEATPEERTTALNEEYVAQ